MITQSTNTIHYSSLIVGAIIGFVISILKDFLNNYMKQKNAQQELKRIKLEEAFEVLVKTMENLKSLENKSIEIDLNRLRMLIEFYFSELSKEFNKYHNVYIHVGQIGVKQIKTNLNERDLEFQYLVFKNQLIGLSRNLYKSKSYTVLSKIFKSLSNNGVS